MMTGLPRSFLPATLVALLTSSPVTAAPAIDFARDIRPILADRCLECHGADKARGGLKLTDQKSALASIVPGKPEQSEFFQRLVTSEADKVMPPRKKAPLTADQIAKLKTWIAQGAPWSDHWAWAPLQGTSPPQVKGSAWARNPIDRYILARLESRGFTPAGEADRYTLLRRLSYDLIGLPPTPEEVEAFVGDTRPDAYERLVDRLLASPRFGERWGRHWLDLAHFADSDGFEKDRARPDAHLWRDWVLEAFNHDLPFDRFTIDQLAGDLIPNATARQKTATGFLRQSLTNEEGGVDQEEFRVEAAFDRTETVSTVWLGLTMGCVRCHGHKYDPIPHQEYYRFFAFFNNTDELSVAVPARADRPDELQRRLAPLESALARRLAELAPQERKWEAEQRQRLLADADGKGKVRGQFPRPVADALEMYPEKRVAGTRQVLFDHFVNKVLRDERVDSLRKQIAGVQREHGAQMMDVRAVGTPLEPRKTFVFNRGEFLSPTKEVAPGVPSVLPSLSARAAQADRLDLARWLVGQQNNLTPRVAVNQVWKHLFGEALVRTMNDFGARGEPPTHPELLDWLAVQYRTQFAWSRKALIRLIVSSATYRQSSQARPDLAELDPANTLLARQNRFRVESEIVRDLSLAVGGLLTPRVGGPSVFPPMPEDLARLSYANNFTWRNSTGGDRHRRGMYTFFKRTIPHPNLMTFDSPDANVACVRRTVSNTPLQALLLLNNVSHVEAARGLAQRLLETPGSDEARLDHTVRLCVARPARPIEIEALREVLVAARTYYQSHTASAAQLAGTQAVASAPETAAWVATVRVMLNADEFLTRP